MIQTNFQGDIYALEMWWGNNAWLSWPLAFTPNTTHTLTVKTVPAHVATAMMGFYCTLIPMTEEESQDKMYVLKPVNPIRWNPGLVYRVPDVIDGTFAGKYFSFPVVNFNYVYAKGVNVTGVVTKGQQDLQAEFAETVIVQPGQASPLPIMVQNDTLYDCVMGASWVDVTFSVCFEFDAEGGSVCLEHEMAIACKQFGESYTFTFLDVDQSVQYAGVTPPINPCSPPPTTLQDRLNVGFQEKEDSIEENQEFVNRMNKRYVQQDTKDHVNISQQRKLQELKDENKKCAIMFATHGAGVDGSNPIWFGSYIEQEAAWILYPTNRGMFGYDWQELGHLNGLRALEVFSTQLPGVPKELQAYYGADAYKILFTGHSMGGHGCLVYSTHESDRSIGSACAAAWVRSDDYVQEYQNTGYSFADTVLEGLLKSSASDTYSDLLASNMKGLPFLGRMGAKDENVCPWNLRRFARVLDEINQMPGFTTISEVQGKPHWWGNVMKDEIMNDYYSEVLSSGKPELPTKFRVSTLDLAAQGRGGIRILQQHSPHIMSHIDIDTEDNNFWTLSTTNVRRFTLVSVPHLHTPSLSYIEIDGVKLQSLFPDQDTLVNDEFMIHYCQEVPLEEWKICEDNTWKYEEKSYLNNGLLSHVFNGQLAIVYGTQNIDKDNLMKDYAVSIANSHFWQGHAQPLILSDEDALTKFESLVSTRNLLLLGGPQYNSYTSKVLPQTTLPKSFQFYENSGNFSVGKLKYSKPGIGIAAFGQRISNTQQINQNPQLVALVSGTDVEGIAAAAGAFPMGGTPLIPDFIVLGPESSWRGEGGILATGYLGNKWEVRYDLMYPRLPIF
eukprot:TRINITY_DN8987_c0_g1_i1.p1 TRINITY_DN8987_c0_g1~~TRINITY_DN8987_c0_g1_i1.p1  ORF type:complete len:960 (-),score=116.29 TRINITY_DN8987_c0_g1_i1:326-2842(-)